MSKGCRQRRLARGRCRCCRRRLGPAAALRSAPPSVLAFTPPLVHQALKLAKKAAKRKQIKRGVKEVIKAIRKKATGCVWW